MILDDNGIRDAIASATGGTIPLQVRIVDGVEQLTDQDRRNLTDAGVSPSSELDGFVSGNELVVNKQRVNTTAQAGVFAAHEILSHVGMRARYGPQLNTSLDRMFTQLGGLNGVIQAAAQYGVSLPDSYSELVNRARSRNDRAAQRALTQEMFAAASEVDFLQPGSRIANGLSDFVSRVKGFLNKFPVIGKVFNTFTERDIMRVVRESGQAARRLQPAVGPLQTAASVGGVARRVQGVNSRDNLVIAQDGTSTVIKAEERGVGADGQPVRVPNEVQDVTNPVEGATAEVKQRATTAAQTVIGTFKDQLRDPVKRRPQDGRLRKAAANSSRLEELVKTFADSQEGLRRVSKKVMGYLNTTPDVMNDLGVRIQESLDTVLSSVDASTQTDFFRSSEQAVESRNIEDLQRDLSRSIDTGNTQDLYDAFSLHTKATRYRGLAMEQVRDKIVEQDAAIDDAVVALAVQLGVTNAEAMDTAGSVLKALTSIEKNDAAYLMNSPVNGIGTTARQKVLERYNALNEDGANLSSTAAQAMRAELEQIGRDNYVGPQGKSYDQLKSEVNTTGLTTASAQTILDRAGVTQDNQGAYTGIVDAVRAAKNETTRMRQSILPQAYFNERTLFGFQHDYPVETVDSEAFPLYANTFTQRGHADFTSETERKSQFTNNTVHNVRIESVLAAQQMHFNSEVLRSLAFNTLAHQVSPEHAAQSGDFYRTKGLRVISKNSDEFRTFSANALNEKEAQNKFIYAVPNSDAALVMEFDTISDAPKQIRGERKGEEIRQWTAFRAASNVTGTMSKLMTRYNTNFIPRSHLREFLIGAFTLGAEEGLGAVGSYLSNSLDNNLNMPDVYNYMRLRNTRTREAERERKALLDRSPKIRMLQEMIEQGGLVTQLSALSEPGQAAITRRNAGNKLSSTGVAFDNWFGSVTDTTDAIVRLSAYETQLSQGKSKQEAANYAKRLANFEARGKYSGILGDTLMFYNPTAVGASRVLESLNEGEFARPAAIAAVGAGMAFHFLAASLSGEDDQDRKLFDREGLDRQTTDLRIPLSNDTTFALPAGFSVMSIGFLMGNQLAGFVRGQQDVSQLAANTFEVLTNNFSPVPASGIPLVDAQGNVRVIDYLVDTATPSALKPVSQFFNNVNGLGLPIYRTGFSNSAGGLTDAFNGRESDIGTWSDRLAIAMHEASGGKIDMNPGTLRHFMSSYFNGINAVMDFGAEAANLSDGVESGNSFVDRSLGFGGFFSKTGHFDDYYQTRRRVDALSKQLKTYEATGRDELAVGLRARLPADFDQIVTAINRNKRAQDKVNAEMRPVIYGTGSVGVRRQAIDLQNEQRRQLQVEGLQLMNQIVQPKL